MASLLQLVSFFSSSWLLITATSSTQLPRQYVVYMGSPSNEKGGGDVEQVEESSHLQLLSSIIPSHESERISLVHHYSHAIKGFSAILTQSEADLLSGHEGVVSVFPDPILKLHTTRSWDFLEALSGMTHSAYEHAHVSSDVIIGIIDTGIWPESPSFSDVGFGEIPPKWKGTCMEGSGSKKFSCNRKLIGARYYGLKQGSESNNNKTKLVGSPRDNFGHGTHTASIAAGAEVADVSYYGLAKGRARGGWPSARIAAYKACSADGCSGATILKAIDDAIKDGVDVISISIGMSSFFESDYLHDPIAIGAFHAQQMGVMVVCSGGNSGPDYYSVVNTAPWIFTVAASNIDRDFQSTLLLGNGKTIQGSAINFSNLTRSTSYPLVFGEDAATKFTPVSEVRNCYPGSLDRRKVAGKIVVCLHDDVSIPRATKKAVAEDVRAMGLILISNDERGGPFDSGLFPMAEVGRSGGIQILKYIKYTEKATATILPAVDVPRYRPAPAAAYFSSRGPGGLTENILKPDIMAPGVAILGAVVPQSEAGSVPKGKKPSGYALKSGTSMACPHVAGAAAFIKSVHPAWTSSMIKSALMTTANIYDNMRKPVTNSSHYTANPHEMGVGEIIPLKALSPGLVFETTTEEYLHFLCYCGYREKSIRSISTNKKFNCPKISDDKLISNINYPSISIGKLDRGRYTLVKRRVANVVSPNTTYIATVHAPVGLTVKVSPGRLVFDKVLERMSFNVSFYADSTAPGGYNFGSVTWFDGRHFVRLMFAVNVL